MGDRFQNRNDGMLFTAKLPQTCYVGQCNKTSVSAPFHLPQLTAPPTIPDALPFFQNILSEDSPKIKI